MHSRKKRKLFLAIGTGFIALILFLVFILPAAIKWQINSYLDSQEAYRGHVDGVSLPWVRPGLSLHDMHLEMSAEPEAQYIKIDDLAVWLSWRSFTEFRWILSSEVSGVQLHAELPALFDEIDKILEPKKEEEKPKKDAPRFSLESLEVTDVKAKVFYKENKINQKIEFYGMSLALKDFSNWQSGERAEFEIWSRIKPSGITHGKVAFDLESSPPVFDLALYAQNILISSFNPTIEEVAKVDIEAGRLSLYTEIESDQGEYEGYIKPVLEGVEVLSDDDLEEKGAGALRDLLAEAVKGILENKKEDQVASRVPIEGKLEDPKIRLMPAVFSVLRNAFIQALTKDFVSPPPTPNVQN